MKLEFTGPEFKFRPDSGEFKCSSCGSKYPVEEGVINFLGSEHYSGNFGFQWNAFRKTQLDSHSGFPIFKDRFFLVSGWPEKTEGDISLEVGCGAGTFTEVAAATGTTLFSVDASSAVYANYKNNSHFKNVVFIRGDLFNLPFEHARFDRVYCLGVVQHTPDPKLAIKKIHEMAKPDGGHVALDVYSKTWNSILWTKYWIRPITKRIPDVPLYHIIKFLTKPMLLCHDVLRLIPKFGSFLAYHLVPVNTYKYSYPFTKQQNFEWAFLDTFDMLSPEFDIPMSREEVEKVMAEIGQKDFRLERGPNGYIFNMVRQK